MFPLPFLLPGTYHKLTHRAVFSVRSPVPSASTDRHCHSEDALPAPSAFVTRLASGLDAMELAADVIQPINIHVQHGMFDFHIVLHILRIKRHLICKQRRACRQALFIHQYHRTGWPLTSSHVVPRPTMQFLAS